jgi:ribonucleoside-triphosphate reductase
MQFEEPKWGPVGKEVYERTYRRNKEDGTPEVWRDTVERVVRGNTALVAESFIEPGERDKLVDLIYNFRVIPAGRHLWVSGVPGRQFLFNCHRAAFTENLSDHYSFTFDQLMQGGGVGANYSNRYIYGYGEIENRTRLHIVCDPEHPDYAEIQHLLSYNYSHLWDGAYRLDDSREGWVESLVSVITSHYTGFDDELVLDVSNVRERGRLIRGFGGTASGPTALAQMLHNVNDLLNDRIRTQLTSLDHMLIDHEIATCVVAGNVRRSARMSIKSWKDSDILDFINCKADYTKHWSTNISVEIDDDFFKALKKRDTHATEVYRAVVTGMLTNGEPGFYNLTLASEGEVGDVGSTNPCGEIALENWENCNLGHVNVEAFADDFEGSKEAFRLMARFLIRATFGDIPNEKQREVVNRNRRIGVGFFGFQGWLVQNGIRFSDSHRSRYVRKTLRDWKAVVDKEKRRYAFQLRIPEPIKGTTIAPTGSVAKLPGATEGIHTVFSRYFIRRIRFSADDPKVAGFIEEGYEVEDCQYTANTKVVNFYCKDSILELDVNEDLVESANEISLADMLAVQSMVQECYADNAVSFTVNVPATEETDGKPTALGLLDEALATIIHYLPHVKGTTIMVDGSRPQAPYERISKAEYDLYEYIKSTGQGFDECSTGACPIK